MSNLDFEILIDNSFADVCTDKSVLPNHNKFVLSLINDFEDGEWRYERFQSFIWDNIAETALSKLERDKLIDKNHSTLVAAAKNLRLTDSNKTDKVGEGSELAEIVLYGIMRYTLLPCHPEQREGSQGQGHTYCNRTTPVRSVEILRFAQNDKPQCDSKEVPTWYYS